VEAGTLTALRSPRTLAIGTSVRIAACPIIMGLVLAHDYTSGTVLFLIAAATDFIDGRLARRWNAVTALGAFLDTTADKLLVCTAMLALVAVGRASPWIALVIVGREFTILGLRAAVSVAMMRPDVHIAGAYLDQWLLGAAAVITAWSGIDYLIRSADALKS
jgi:CDP-diacylglycerol--glycerol-3-phosphate 3-phosphatidyltransferase